MTSLQVINTGQYFILQKEKRRELYTLNNGWFADTIRRAGNGCLLFQHGPIKNIIVLVTQRSEQNSEKLSKVHIVRRFFKPQTPAVIDVHRELGRVAFA